MRDLINIMESSWNNIRDGRHLADTPAFKAWFNGSKCLTSDGHPMMMFHASMSNDIEEFMPEKIRENDLDAPFNGFWFSSDPETQPAWCSMDELICIPVFLAIKNPASWQVWRKIVRDVHNELDAHDYEDGMNPIRQGARSTHDEVRYRLQDMGYDGIVWESPPAIDRDAFQRDGKFEYKDNRGHNYWIEKGQHEKTRWEEVERTYYEVYLDDGVGTPKKSPMSNPQSVLNDILDALGWWKNEGDEKIDWSKYNVKDMEGEVSLGNKTIVVRKIPKVYKSKEPVRTGEYQDTVEYFQDSIGHITGYEDIDDFLDSHKHQVWVAFSPTQIKSAFNKGDWNPSNPKITEGERLNEARVVHSERMHDGKGFSVLR